LTREALGAVVSVGTRAPAPPTVSAMALMRPGAVSDKPRALRDSSRRASVLVSVTLGR